MVRLFDLRDISLVARLENKGGPLCSELALARGLYPLQSALAGYLSLHRRGAYTSIAFGGAGPEGFTQMRLRRECGVLTYIAPRLTYAGAGSTWFDLLEAMSATAGRLGLHYVVAEAPAEGAELAVLRQAGFALYLRQDILRLAPRVELPAQPARLRPAVSDDAWAIQQLYYNTAPRLAQLVEAFPQAGLSRAVRGYVLEEAGEVMAYLQVHRGPLGAWFDVMIHPQAETSARHVLAHGLLALGEDWSKPVYCCVRRYQEWLREPLMALGFESFASSVVLGKRLVVPVAESELARVAALETHHVTSPVVRAARPDERYVWS